MPAAPGSHSVARRGRTPPPRPTARTSATREVSRPATCHVAAVTSNVASAGTGQSSRCSTEHDEDDRSIARSCVEPARRGVRDASGRADERDVDALEQLRGRRGPRAARSWHEHHATQVDAQLGHRDHAGVVEADGGAPAARGGCGDEQRQGRARSHRVLGHRSRRPCWRVGARPRRRAGGAARRPAGTGWTPGRWVGSRWRAEPPRRRARRRRTYVRMLPTAPDGVHRRAASTNPQLRGSARQRGHHRDSESPASRVDESTPFRAPRVTAPAIRTSPAAQGAARTRRGHRRARAVRRQTATDRVRRGPGPRARAAGQAPSLARSRPRHPRWPPTTPPRR